MTDQEIFDKVATHLLKQKSRSLDEYNKCMYRGDNGTMCAVGALIPDEVYNSRMEYCPVEDIVREYVVLDYLKPHMSILSELQTLHDHSDPALWLTRLDLLAREFKLNTIVLDQFE